MGANIVTAGQAITLEDATNHDSITLSDTATDSILLDATAGGNVSYLAGALITINGPIDGSVVDTQSLTVRPGQQTWTMGQAIGATTRLASFTLRADDIALGAAVKAVTINLYTATPATRAMSIGGGTTGFQLSDGEMTYLQDFSTLAVGEAGIQVYEIYIDTITRPSGGSALVVSADGGSYGISLGDGSVTAGAISWSTGAITLAAGSGGIVTSSASTNGYPEITTSGLLSVRSSGAGTIGDSATDRLEIDGSPSSIVVSAATGAVYLRGLASLTFGNVTTGNGLWDVDTSSGSITLSGAANTGTGIISIAAATTIYLNYAGASDITTSGSLISLASPVVCSRIRI